MLKKYSVPMALGDRAKFSTKGAPDRGQWVELTKLDVTNGVLSWEAITNKGHALKGNGYVEVPNPLLPEGCWLKPKIPIVMHLRNGVCAMEVIFCIPGATYIEVVRAS